VSEFQFLQHPRVVVPLRFPKPIAAALHRHTGNSQCVSKSSATAVTLGSTGAAVSSDALSCIIDKP
jgi:hypothetical protein